MGGPVANTALKSVGKHITAVVHNFARFWRRLVFVGAFWYIAGIRVVFSIVIGECFVVVVVSIEVWLGLVPAASISITSGT